MVADRFDSALGTGRGTSGTGPSARRFDRFGDGSAQVEQLLAAVAGLPVHTLREMPVGTTEPIRRARLVAQQTARDIEREEDLAAARAALAELIDPVRFSGALVACCDAAVALLLAESSLTDAQLTTLLSRSWLLLGDEHPTLPHPA